MICHGFVIPWYLFHTKNRQYVCKETPNNTPNQVDNLFTSVSSVAGTAATFVAEIVCNMYVSMFAIPSGIMIWVG
jgi:hypothetical protein